jgi:Flp pilus assembly protein TadB
MRSPRDDAMNDFERRLAPYYPVFIALGIFFFVIGMLNGRPIARLVALIWLLAVPLWVIRYRAYRRGDPGGPQRG